MAMQLETAWQGMDLVVTRGGSEIDRIAGGQIERVVLVCHGAGDTPGDLAFAVIETPNEAVVLPAESGIAGRVHFERQAFWAERRCIYWASDAQAALPRRLRPGLGLLRRSRAAYMRVARTELASTIDGWPLDGPKTWEERKWERIARLRLLAPLDQAPRRGRPAQKQS